jgi:hypothetical protein
MEDKGFIQKGRMRGRLCFVLGCDSTSPLGISKKIGLSNLFLLGENG